MLGTSLTASQGLDCKTVGFFLKIGKAWRKSPTREAGEPRTPCSRPFVWLLSRTWIRKNTDCFAVYPRVESNKTPAKPYHFFAALFHRKDYLDEVIHERHLTVLLDLVKRDSIHYRFDESTVIWGHHNSISTKNKRQRGDVITRKLVPCIRVS